MAKISYVEGDVLQVAQLLHDYDEKLELEYFDPGPFPNKNDLMEAPWRVVENCPDGTRPVVARAWVLGPDIMTQIYKADRYKHDVLANLRLNNLRAKLAITRRFDDVKAEAKDVIQAVLKSPKVRYTAPTFVESVFNDERKVHRFE